MAAAGPKGRDGPSPREFTTVRHFMMADLGLSGLPLLVYARIFGFLLTPMGNLPITPILHAD